LVVCNVSGDDLSIKEIAVKRILAVVLLLGASVLLTPSHAQGAAVDVHVVVENSRTFRDMTRKTIEEFWAAPDKMLWKMDNFLWITRKDLGVLWGVSRRANTYMEDKLAPAGAPAKPPQENIHTRGWDFGLGRVDWTMESTGESRTISGIPCECTIARGRSDTSEITVQLWLAPASTPGAADILKLIAEPIRSDERRAPIADLLDKLGGRLPLEREETIDGPISPPLKYAVKVVKLEFAAAPSGTYDLPAGAKKEDPNAKAAPRPAGQAFVLPAAAVVELKRLEEAYYVLDFASEKVWTGWTNYKDFPFQFVFENGLKVLIGHPNPPPGFEPLPGMKIAGLKVFVDRRQMSGLEIKQPLSCGGGVGLLGESGGRPVTIVDMKFTKIPSDPRMKDKPFRAERTILILVHELFHCFQADAVQIAYGNLSYNADAEYALYSSIEGLALDAAYRASDAGTVRVFLKDFLLARELKRRSMTDRQAGEESSDDVREGTAVYSEVRTLETLRDGFKPRLSGSDDSFYGGFKDSDGLFRDYAERLKTSAEDLFDTKGKCYTYGSFQALLLQRYFPGWQEPFAREPRLLDEELGKRMALTGDDRAGVEKRFKAVYGFAALKTKARKAMAEREAAFRSVTGAKGLTYAVNFKEIGQFAGTLPVDKKSYHLGLISVYPDGVGKLAFDDVEIDVRHKPVEIDKIYHLIMVDPDAAKRTKPYELTFEKQDGTDTYVNAVVTTPLFTLKAPKVRIVSDAGRVKIWILARVKS
jgi:hypothetical protein